MSVILIICVCTAVLIVYWPVLSSQALSFDDNQYLTENVLVQNPSLASARRFLAEVLEPSSVQGYYQPLTMISLMLDYAAGGRKNNLLIFHCTSMALHIANTALIITLLYLLFEQPWIAAAMGLLFGVHPLTVEPIPWVGERKTLLAAFFALWCLILYVRYAHTGRRGFYIGCLMTYVLALMSKPTSTTLPAVMLLMDYWPLYRLKWRTVLEKMPFFVVGGISAVITYISQSRTAIALLPSEYKPSSVPLLLCHNIIFYLHKILWPAELSSHYALPEPWGISNPIILISVIGTAVLFFLLIISLRWTRAALTGWLIFFAAIFPTMGVVGFTNVIAADKFVYLPAVGLLMILTAFLKWLFSSGKIFAKRIIVAIVILALAGSEAAATRRHIAHWRDTLGLFEYMLKLTPDAIAVHNMLGIILQSHGRLDEAIIHYRKVIETSPQYVEAYNNLAGALLLQRKFDEAVGYCRKAIQLKPDYAEAYSNLGLAFQSQGRLDEAVYNFNKALQQKSEHPDIYYNLATAFQAQGKLDKAAEHYRQALRLRPEDAEAHYNLGSVLQSLGKTDEAVSHFREALKLAAAAGNNELAAEIESRIQKSADRRQNKKF